MAQETEDSKAQLDWHQLSQAWTLKSIKCMLHRFDLMEGMMRNTQEAKATGILEELQRDVEALRKLYHEVESGVRDTTGSLEDLNEQVNDHYRRLNEKVDKTGKNIEFMSEVLNRQQEHIDTTKEKVRGAQSSISAQSEEVRKLNDSLLDVTRSVQSLDNKLDSLHRTFDQKSRVDSEEKHIIEKLVDGQAQFQDSINRLAPFQERLSRLLEPPPVLSSLVALDDSLTGEQTTQNDAHTPQAPACPPKRSPPAAAQQMLEKYAKFRKSYMARRPKNEARFIRGYLKELDRRIAWFLQKELQKDYPDLVGVLEAKKRGRMADDSVFVNVDRLSWQHVKDTMHRADYRPLYDLLERDLDGVDELIPLRG
ncbi:hypothetical protein F4779DRAFT_617237 [Xylariaceae sp. FL0662B]|nr:hypothetical protein F4779DRAFT_617237 [Xylariaceae sp. FL0662B]